MWWNKTVGTGELSDDCPQELIRENFNSGGCDCLFPGDERLQLGLLRSRMPTSAMQILHDWTCTKDRVFNNSKVMLRAEEGLKACGVYRTSLDLSRFSDNFYYNSRWIGCYAARVSTLCHLEFDREMYQATVEGRQLGCAGSP